MFQHLPSNIRCLQFKQVLFIEETVLNLPIVKHIVIRSLLRQDQLRSVCSLNIRSVFGVKFHRNHSKTINKSHSLELRGIFARYQKSANLVVFSKFCFVNSVVNNSLFLNGEIISNQTGDHSIIGNQALLIHCGPHNPSKRITPQPERRESHKLHVFLFNCVNR